MNVDYLKKISVEDPYYHGLGMIKLRVRHTPNKFYNYHFFSNKYLEQICDDVHNHLYSFKSKLVQGSAINEYYKYTPVDHETEWVLEVTDCLEGQVPEVIHENVELELIEKIQTNEGEGYHCDKDDFHRFVPVSDHVVTYSQHYTKDGKRGLFVRNKSIPFVCAFSKPKQKENCWEIIDSILKENDK